MTKKTSIGLLGGSFDPPHLGHLALAEHALRELQLKQVVLMPCYQHAFSKQLSDAKHRFAMLQLLLKEQTQLVADDYEINKQQISYTIDTLAEMKQQSPQKNIIYLMGEDVLQTLNQWQRADELFDYCHLAVFSRKAYKQNSTPLWLKALIEKRKLNRVEQLNESSCGGIYFFEIDIPHISATQIRHSIAQRQTPCTTIIPEEVARYAITHHLYT